MHKFGIWTALFILLGITLITWPSLAQDYYFAPVSGQITSSFGWRADPFNSMHRFHGGIDIAANTGAPVYATQAGVVMFSGFYRGYGNVVVLNHGNSLYTLYGHNSRLLVQAGQAVYRGQTISLVGSTGHSTGPHLHFEVHYNQQYLSPLSYLAYIQQKSPLIPVSTNTHTTQASMTRQQPHPAHRKTTPKARTYTATVQVVNGTHIHNVHF